VNHLKNKQYKTWAVFIENLHAYFKPRDFFTKLTVQVKQRKHGSIESFKDYKTDMHTLMKSLGHFTKETLNIIKENFTLNLRISVRAYKISDLDTLMVLADEFEELEKEREAFAQENKFSRTKSSRRCEDTGDHEPRRNDRRQATHTPYGGQRAPQQYQQR